MWIEPTAFAPTVGSVVGLRLRVGENFVGDPIARDPALIEEFVAIEGAARTPIPGRDGADPAGLVRVAAPGLIIAGYRSRPSPVTLQAEKFNQYLKEEGLDHVVEMRTRRNETQAPVRELFSRYAKSLILSNPIGSETDRPIGFTLELVAERSPFTRAARAELPVRLTYLGRPVARAQVVAISRVNPTGRLTARTDQGGRVRLRLPNDGAWLIKAVHMVPAEKDSGADWVSYWASLTFQVKR
jgi:hypothetical protein